MEISKEDIRVIDQCVAFSLPPTDPGITTDASAFQPVFSYPVDSPLPPRIQSFLFPERNIPQKIVNNSAWFDAAEYLLDTIWGKLPEWDEVTAIARAAAATPASLSRVRDGELAMSVNYTARSPVRITLPAQGHVAPTTLLRSLSLNRVVSILAAILRERRLIFVSEDLHRVTACIWGMLAFLGPLAWQHVLIPVLPNSLLNYCAAPMPFILGILQDEVDEVQKLPLEEVVFVYCDENKIVGADIDDEIVLPETVYIIKNALTSARADLTAWPASSSSVAELMHRDFRLNIPLMNAVDQFWSSSWIGQYRRFLQLTPTKQVTFDKASFVKAAPKKFHVFLEALVASQMWDHFILEREKLVESGVPFPNSNFELLVDSLMEQPLPDSTIKLDGIKSFFKDRLDKAAKLALEYPTQTSPKLSFLSSILPFTLDFTLNRFVSDDPHDQFVPQAPSPRAAPAPRSHSETPLRSATSSSSIAPILPAPLRSHASPVGSSSPGSQTVVPRDTPKTSTMTNGPHRAVQHQSIPSVPPKAASAPTLKAPVKQQAGVPRPKVTNPQPALSKAPLPAHPKHAVTYDLISLHDHDVGPSGPQARPPAAQAQRSHDLIDFSESGHTSHFPAAYSQPVLSHHYNPFLDPAAMAPSNPRQSPQPQPWNPFAPPS